VNSFYLLDSIAENAGLLPGDLIIKINGKNVSRATCYSIVKIIKYVLNIFIVDDLFYLLLFFLI
jgi:hypothetical protein